MDKAAAKKKEEEEAQRDLSSPQVLMKAVAEAVGDKAELQRFKQGSGQYSRGELSCAEYECQPCTRGDHVRTHICE